VRTEYRVAKHPAPRPRTNWGRGEILPRQAETVGVSGWSFRREFVSGSDPAFKDQMGLCFDDQDSVVIPLDRLVRGGFPDRSESAGSRPVGHVATKHVGSWLE
jgi:hypothetical protein